MGKHLTTTLLVILVAWTTYMFAFIKLNDLFWELSKCPACYGQVDCHQLKDNLVLDKWSLRNLINTKNVYYGYLLNHKVVIKKLAHTLELNSFDKIICNHYSHQLCNVGHVWMDWIGEKYLFVNDSIKALRNVIFELKSEAETEGLETGVISCPSDNFLKTTLDQFEKSDPIVRIANAATILLINPEPIIQQILVDRMPKLFGICGRVIVEEYIGPTLTEFYSSSWITRLKLAASLIELANELSFRQPSGFALYLTDVSFDNFAVSNLKVKLVDGESVVAVDLNSSSCKSGEFYAHNLEHSGNELSFSVDDLCSASSADHNHFAIAKCLLAEEPCSPGFPGGLLWGIPEHIENQWYIKSIVTQIIKDVDKRVETSTHLLKIINLIIQSNY